MIFFFFKWSKTNKKALIWYFHMVDWRQKQDLKAASHIKKPVIEHLQYISKY